MERGDYVVNRVAREVRMSRQAIYRHIEASPNLRLATQIPLAEIESTLSSHEGDLAQTARSLRVSRHSLKLRMRECDTAEHRPVR